MLISRSGGGTVYLRYHLCDEGTLKLTVQAGVQHRGFMIHLQPMLNY